MKNKLNSQTGELALQQGITAARAGYKNLASVQLERAAELLPDNADVWLWLAWLANSPDNTRRCLQQVLAINPGHPAATAGLIWVNSLTAEDSIVSRNEVVSRNETRIDSRSTSPEIADLTENRLVEVTAPQLTQVVEQASQPMLAEVDPRDRLDARPITDLAANFDLTKAESEKAYDSDGWEVSITPAVETPKADVSVADMTRTTVAQTTIKPLEVDAPASDEDSRRRRWNELVSRAAEMPLNARKSLTVEKPLTVEKSNAVENSHTVESVKNPAHKATTLSAEVSVSSNSLAAPVKVAVPPVEAKTAVVAEVAVPAPEATVQSRFTDVPATTPRAESPNVTINDSITRLRQPTATTTTAATATAARPPEPEPEAESSADIEKLAQSFHPLTDAVIADGRPLVMVVDDSPTVRKLVSLTLERRGYRVISAFDGVAAIKELGSHRPDLILLDINMPRLDGYRLCKLIKKHEATQSIPVVMLSGKDGMFDKLRGRLVGCSDYITKPFEADALTVKVAKYLTATTASSL